MALAILLIPVMSANPECLFLGTKITVSDRRNRLGIYIIKALECLKSWLRIDVFMDNYDDDQLLDKEITEGSEGRGAIEID